jgi:hypothetical protein
VDGLVLLDDGSTDGGAEFVAAHPKVLELLRIAPRQPHRWDELRNKRLLVDAAGRHGADWVIALDADERVEQGFRARADAALARAEAEGLGAFSINLRELWDRHDQYRVDGVWGLKRNPRLFRYRPDHDFGGRELHGVWAPENGRAANGGFAHADLEVYHLRMVHALDRQRRMARYQALDPESRWQAIGYAYLADETGCQLARIPEARTFEPFEMPAPPEPDRNL